MRGLAIFVFLNKTHTRAYDLVVTHDTPMTETGRVQCPAVPAGLRQLLTVLPVDNGVILVMYHE